MQRLWVCLVVCVLSPGSGVRAEDEAAIVRPADNGAALVNPGMGWVFHYYDNIPAHYGSKLAPADTLDNWPGLSVIYRLQLAEASWPRTARAGGSVAIQCTWRNAGVAHRPLLVVLECVPSWLAFVPEMERMADLDGSLREHRWSEADGTKYAAELRRIQADWNTRAPTIQALLTPERVRSLSKWAVKQMEAYATVPSLEKAQLQPVAADEEQDTIILESTIDTLPTHHPLVTRWLKAFVRYDNNGKKIVHVTITIRGQRLE